MARWEPNARERLEEAAMELFQERGYTHTTVEEIAARAGLTERTFFRYFTDKREVLFGRSSALAEFIVELIASASPTTAPLDAVVSALEGTERIFEKSRHAYARKRLALIAAHAELRERELIKLSSLASAIAQSLRARGVADPFASLTAEAGIAIFKVAFEGWVNDSTPRNFAHYIRATRDALHALVASKST